MRCTCFRSGQWIWLALRNWLSGVFAIGVKLLLISSVCAETGELMDAAGLALTGSRDVDTKMIGDPAECVFGIKKDLFRLNNVYTDLIKIEARQGLLEQWVSVTLHGGGLYLRRLLKEHRMTARNSCDKCACRVRRCSDRITIPTHNTNCIWRLKIWRE